MNRLENLKKVFEYLRQNENMEVSLDELLKNTLWKKSTLKTHISKKLKPYIHRLSDSNYRITGFQNLSFDDFNNLLKQISIVPPKILTNYNQNKSFLNEQRYGDIGYIDSIHIMNFICIKEIHIENLKDKREIYFLGENGDGKTLLLQSIFISNHKEYIKEFAIQPLIGIINKNSDFISDNKYTIVSTNRRQASQQLFVINHLQNLFAYGAYRNSVSLDLVDLEFMTLFYEKAELIHPLEWLKDLDYKQLKKENTSISVELAKEILEDILGEKKGDIKIDLSTSNIKIHEKGTEINFDQLSSGYRIVMIWISDLLVRLMKSQPDIKKTEDYRAVVLVDEISLHLHPKWEYRIVKKLREWFPNIQWIFTTHSPIVLLGASKDAVVYKLYKEDGCTKISEPYNMESFSNKMINSFITSPLFDLPRAYPASFNSSKI